MIKINVITRNNSWFKYIKRPNYYLDKKIEKLNLKAKEHKKIIFFVLCYYQGIKKLKILIGNLEKKIKLQMYYRFHFIQKRNLRKILR